jgi:large subunit ribosomal protein L28
MAKCQRCGKGRQFGHNVSFSKRHTNRDWKPNIQTTTVVEGGTTKRIKVCTNCLKTMRKTV